MQVVKIIATVLLVMAEIFLIAVVLLQSGKSAGLSGAIGGGDNTDTFFGKNKGKTLEGKLERWTKISAIAFLVLAIAIALLNK